jgi:hypothetical protein
MTGSKRIGLVSGVIALAVVVLIVFSSMGLDAHTVEVCVVYQERENCGTASGSTREEALRTAQTTACATISSGVSETIGCSRVEPVSVTWID